MKKYRISKTGSAELAVLKQEYRRQLSNPLDGMWESFVEMADHFSIDRDDRRVGYCVVNAERKLLQFNLNGANDPRSVFQQVLKELNVTGAFLSTCEPEYLSLCMDHQKFVLVKAIMYRWGNVIDLPTADFPSRSQFRVLTECELEPAVGFAVETLGADSNWLRDYFSKRIEGEELFGLWLDRILIATGEYRPSMTQVPFADLGMIVAKQYRGQGIATNILLWLVDHCHQQGREAICSTDFENLPAQKAIMKSGFTSRHRVLDVSF